MNAQQFTEASIAEMVAGVKKYLHTEREVYLRHSEPLTPDVLQMIEGFFSADLLARLRTITLTGARVPPPPFYLKAKEMSGGKFPDFVHMDAITYIDVIVFHDRILPRALFHGAVHSAQIAVLGFDKYVDLYVRGFAKHLSWLAIPMEAQAYQLDARYSENPTELFSVENEIREWDAAGRY